jgi:Tol biopolymer transport system component
LIKNPGVLLWPTFFLLSCTYVGKAQLPIIPVRTISFSSNESSYTDVDVSADGKTLLLSLWGQLYTLPVNGGSAKRLTQGLPMINCPVWSPNGKLIAYVSDATGVLRVHVQDLSGSFQKVLGESESQSFTLNPVWLPDSRQVAANEMQGLNMLN